MNHTWLVIANSTNAFVYHLQNLSASADLPQTFREHTHAPLIKSFEHPEGRLAGRDLVTDKDGSYKTSHATRGHFEEHKSPHKVQNEHFAIELGHYLQKAHAEQTFQHVIICAEPGFYGILKAHLSKEILAHETHILKDYVPLQQHGLSRIVDEIQKEKVWIERN